MPAISRAIPLAPGMRPTHPGAPATRPGPFRHAAAAQPFLLQLPRKFTFHRGFVDFDYVFDFFDWTLNEVPVLVDFTNCESANYQAVALLILDFRNPIRVGEWIVLKSSVNRVFDSSMEIGVKVFAENVLTGQRKHTSSAYLTFVAIDADGKPHSVPHLILETAEDRRRYRDAGKRRKIRLHHRYGKAAARKMQDI
jgi:acyl-CoA thioesterase FadM